MRGVQEYMPYGRDQRELGLIGFFDICGPHEKGT